MSRLLIDGGETGAQMRAHDWSATPLGDPGSWPMALRNAVNLMLSSPESMYLVWGPDLTFLFNDAYRPILGPRADGALGQPLRVLWADAWDAVREPLEAALDGRASRFNDVPIAMARRGVPEETWWSYSYSPIHDGEQVRGVLCYTRETTAEVVGRHNLEAVNARLTEREGFLADVLAASTDCIKVLDLDGRLAFMSEGGRKVMEVDDFDAIEGCPWPDLLTGSASDAARGAIEAAREGQASHFEMAASTFAGTPKWWDVSVSPIRDANGTVSRILSVSRDRTALRQAQEQQEVVNQEISHRLKNTMAMVQAIVGQTLRGVPDRAPVEALADRLHALAAAHDTLLEGSWTAAGLEAVARRVLATFDRSGRISFDGPPVDLSAKAALSLSLLLHELGTNALKYGALSAPNGRVDLTWAVRDHEGEPTLELDWRERDGPPVVPSEGRGFGSRLMRMGLLGTGGSTVRFNLNGLEVTFSASLVLLQSR